MEVLRFLITAEACHVVQCPGGLECGALPHVSGQASGAAARAQEVLREEAACRRH